VRGRRAAHLAVQLGEGDRVREQEQLLRVAQRVRSGLDRLGDGAAPA
jgi:hypothetical protein